MWIEHLIHNTKAHKAVCNFDSKFYKFPTYFMRSAIADGYGIVSAYMSSIDNWVANDCKGAMSKIDKATHQMPCFYRGNRFRNWKDDTAEIKVYRNNDWV